MPPHSPRSSKRRVLSLERSIHEHRGGAVTAIHVLAGHRDLLTADSTGRILHWSSVTSAVEQATDAQTMSEVNEVM